MCVLIVEDEPIVRMAAAESLHEAGYNVMEAAHAIEALKLFDQMPEHFSLLLTDYNLPPPKMTGTELAIRARRRFPAMPIILVTSTPSLIDETTRLEHRLHLLPKPYALPRLARLVGELIPPHRLPDLTP